MIYSISFKTFKQLAYAFSLYDANFGAKLYYSKRIDFDSDHFHNASYLWSLLKKMSDDKNEDFTISGCRFLKIDFESREYSYIH